MARHSHTFLFTDLVNSSSLWEQYPDVMKPALAHHDAILRNAVEEYGGTIIKSTGDGILAIFDKPNEGIQAAVACQHGMHAASWPKQTGELSIRIGLHLGDAEHRDGDLFGSEVNRAARLMSAAHGGQIVVSSILTDANEILSEGISLQDLGVHRLKGFSKLTHIFQINAPGLPQDFSSLNTLDISPNNLPIQLNKFIGREKEMVIVKNLLSTHRLVTLTGSGGAGKSRLSLEIADTLQDVHPDGVWLVELASQTDPAAVPQTVAIALGFESSPEIPIQEQLIDFLKKRTTLLIFDNCEHLIDASAQLANALLQQCPNLRILASSREALGIPGEAAYRVPSLSVPAQDSLNDLEELENIESIQLFIVRAQSVKPDFSLTPENGSTIAQICQRLDGIPLAIELAAVRVQVMSVSQIASRLDDRFRLLTGGSRTALPRQQTLRALIDWSYTLLSENEKTLLRRLSVFTGGWDLEAAEAVCSGEDLDSYEILDLLSSLVDKSLINTEETDIGIRYRCLETIRQYAREKFLDTDDVLPLRNAHLDYFASQAQKASLETMAPNVFQWIRKLNLDLENYDAALSWAAGEDLTSGFRILNALFPYTTELESYLYIFKPWYTDLIEQADGSVPVDVLAQAYQNSAYHSIILEVKDKRYDYRMKSEALYESIQDFDGIAYVRAMHAVYLIWDGDFNKAEKEFLESVTQLEKSNSHHLVFVYGLVAQHLYGTVDNFLSISYAEKAFAIASKTGNIFHLRDALTSLFILKVRVGKFDEARKHIAQFREINQKLVTSRDEEEAIYSGIIAYFEGNFEQAKKHFSDSLKVFKSKGNPPWKFWPMVYLSFPLVKLGDFQGSYDTLTDAVDILPLLPQKTAATFLAESFAHLAASLKKHQIAAQLIAWADQQRIEISDPRPPVEQNVIDGVMSAAITHLNAQEIENARELGEKMTAKEIIDFAAERTRP